MGMHGAGLANAVFCPQGSHLVEIALPEPGTQCYAHLAAAMHLTYWQVIACAPLLARGLSGRKKPPERPCMTTRASSIGRCQWQSFPPEPTAAGASTCPWTRCAPRYTLLRSACPAARHDTDMSSSSANSMAGQSLLLLGPSFWGQTTQRNPLVPRQR